MIVTHQDTDGRLIIIDCLVHQMNIRIINIYAPNLDKERQCFIKGLNQWCTPNTLIFGVFNVVQTDMDISVNNVFKTDVSRRELQQLMVKGNMCDVWRASNPSKSFFSRKQVVNNILRQSRIDLCVASELLCKNIDKQKYVQNVWSDHSTYSCCLQSFTERRGVWCFNSSLLSDVLFRGVMNKMLKDANIEIFLNDDILLWWTELKSRI